MTLLSLMYRENLPIALLVHSNPADAKRGQTLLAFDERCGKIGGMVTGPREWRARGTDGAYGVQFPLPPQGGLRSF